MKSVKRITQTVENTAELRELEHFIAVQGGRIVSILSNRNSVGLSVTYELLISDD